MEDGKDNLVGGWVSKSTASWVLSTTNLHTIVDLTLSSELTSQIQIF